MERVELLVLAGGFGTRLRAAVPGVPKPLAPVAGRPFLHYQIANWIAQHVASLTFLLHNEADMIRGFLAAEHQEGRLQGCNVRSVTEPQPLGTGGAIAFAVRELEIAESFLVANADTWLGHGIQDVAAAQSPAVALVRVDDCSRYGRVELEQTKVTAFHEKQPGAGRGWINAGLYNLRRDLFEAWDGEPFSLERSVLPSLVEARTLDAVAIETDFIDIGMPNDYHRFCRWVESGRAGAP